MLHCTVNLHRSDNAARLLPKYHHRGAYSEPIIGWHCVDSAFPRPRAGSRLCSPVLPRGRLFVALTTAWPRCGRINLASCPPPLGSSKALLTRRVGQASSHSSSDTHLEQSGHSYHWTSRCHLLIHDLDVILHKPPRNRLSWGHTTLRQPLSHGLEEEIEKVEEVHRRREGELSP